jgi:hypothetical protein
LRLSGRTAGDVVRALAWLEPEKAGEALRALRAKLRLAEMKEVASAHARLPTCPMLRPWILIIWTHLDDLQFETGVKDSSGFGIAHVSCRFSLTTCRCVFLN